VFGSLLQGNFETFLLVFLSFSNIKIEANQNMENMSSNLEITVNYMIETKILGVTYTKKRKSLFLNFEWQMIDIYTL
jgi:hypothetical protein